MKKSIVVASLLILGTSSFASQVKDDWFIGVQAGSSTYEVDVKADIGYAGLYNEDYIEDDQGYISFRAGKYFKYGRVYVNYDYYDAKSYMDLNYFGAGYDYLFYNSTKFTPYIGASVGYMQMEVDGFMNEDNNKRSIDISSVTYGFNIGAIYEINKNFDIEISASYRAMDEEDDLVYSGNKIRYTSEDVAQIGVGFNYNF